MNYILGISFLLSIYQTICVKEIYGVTDCNITSSQQQHCCIPICNKTVNNRCTYSCPHDMYVFERLCPGENEQPLNYFRCINTCPKSYYGIIIKNEKVCVRCAILCQSNYLGTLCTCDLSESKSILSNVWFIPFISVSTALFVFLVILCCCCCYRLKRKSRKPLNTFESLENHLQNSENKPKDGTSIEDTDPTTTPTIGTNLQELAVEAQRYQDDKCRYTKDPTSQPEKKDKRLTHVISGVYENAATIRLNKFIDRVSARIKSQFFGRNEPTCPLEQLSTKQVIIQRTEGIQTTTNENNSAVHVHNEITHLSSNDTNDETTILKTHDTVTVTAECTNSINIGGVEMQEKSDDVGTAHQKKSKQLDGNICMTERHESVRIDNTNKNLRQTLCTSNDGQASGESCLNDEMKDENDDGYEDMYFAKDSDSQRKNTLKRNVSTEHVSPLRHKVNKDMARESSSSEASNNSTLTNRSGTSSGSYETANEDQGEVSKRKTFSKTNKGINKNASHNQNPKIKSNPVTNTTHRKRKPITNCDGLSAMARETTSKPSPKRHSSTKLQYESPPNLNKDRQVNAKGITNQNENINNEESTISDSINAQSNLYENVPFGEASCSEHVKENGLINGITEENRVQFRDNTCKNQVRESIVSDISTCTQRSNKSSSSYETPTEGDDGTLEKAISTNTQNMTGQTNLNISNSTVNLILNGQQTI